MIRKFLNCLLALAGFVGLLVLLAIAFFGLMAGVGGGG